MEKQYLKILKHNLEMIPISHYHDNARVSQVLGNPHAHNQFPVLIIIVMLGLLTFRSQPWIEATLK